MYKRFQLVTKSTTLADLSVRFKVIESLTPTPCRVAGCIIPIRPMYSCAGALTYLLTYTVGSGRIKPAISPKRLNIKWKLLLTAY